MNATVRALFWIGIAGLVWLILHAVFAPLRMTA